MVAFIENDPAIEKKVPKYSFYFPLFEDIKDHSLIRPYTPYGYSKDVEAQDDFSLSKETFRYHYSLDGQDIMVISNIFVTIMSEGVSDQTYDLFSNPDNVRLSAVSGTILGRDYELDSNGLPDDSTAQTFYAVEIILDSPPTDGMGFLVEVLGDNEDVIVTGGDVVSVVSRES